METDIRIKITKDGNPELYNFFKSSKISRLKTLEALFNENKVLHDHLDTAIEKQTETFIKIMLKELIPIRLALRSTEKNTWYLSQLKNTELVEREMFEPANPYLNPVTLRTKKTLPFQRLDVAWDEFITEQQVKQAEKRQRILEDTLAQYRAMKGEE